MNYSELIERLADEADLCRNDGADDIAKLLDEAKAAIRALAGSTECPMCGPGSSSFENPHKEFCDKHYHQYLLTVQIRPANLAEYRAQAMAARSGETGTGSTEGNSAVPIGDAPKGGHDDD